MKILQQNSVRFRADAGFGEATELCVRFSNRGEPYREGIELSLDTGYNNHATLLLTSYEAQQLRDLLNQIYPR